MATTVASLEARLAALEEELASFPQIQRLRAERAQREDAAMRVAARRAFINASAEERSAIIREMPVAEREQLFYSLGAADAVAVLRGVDRAALAAAFASMPAHLRVRVAYALAPPAPWVRVQLHPSIVRVTTPQRPITEEEAYRLVDAGGAGAVRGVGRTVEYAGSFLENGTPMPADLWEAIVAIDHDVAAYVELGKATAVAVPDDDAIELSIARHRDGDPLPEVA